MTREQEDLIRAFFRDGGADRAPEGIRVRGDRACMEILRPSMLAGIEVFRNGLFAGEWKKGRFEPSEPLALALKEEEYPRRFSMKSDDPRLSDFLKGLEIQLAEDEGPLAGGWVLICVENYPIGWGKSTKDRIKNKYPVSWRRNG